MPCKEWTGARDRDGYGTLGRRKLRAHRIAWEAAYGPIPPGLLVCHHCDNPPCVEPTHLFIGTAADNMQDASAKGRLPTHPPGEAHPNAKLTDAQVHAIRDAYQRHGHPNQLDLARTYGMSQASINRMLRGTR
jgi:hypothetical protein